MLVIPREDRRAERNYQLPLRKAKAHCKTDEAVPSVWARGTAQKDTNARAISDDIPRI